MNNPDPFARVRGQLHQAAAQVRLTAGSEVATIRAAHRRRNRSRALVGVTTAVAVGGGTVVAIQQLGKTSSGSVAVGNETGTTPDHAVEPIVVASIAPTTVAADSEGQYGTVPGMPEFDVQPAVAAESRYTWNATSVDAANAVSSYWLGRVPGVIISTAPGRAGDPNAVAAQQLYYTEDGITFEPLDVELPDTLNRGGRLYADGDSIYRVGTSPGVAETEPNPMLVEYSPDRGATWVPVELPVDTHELRGLDHVATNYQAELVSTDAGPVFVVRRSAGFDFRGIEDLVGSVEFRHTPEGIAVADPACVEPSATATTITVNGAYAPAQTTPPPEQDPYGGCYTLLHTWADLGIPEESLPYVGPDEAQSSRLFRIVDGAPVEVPAPEGVTNLSATGEGAFVAYSDEGAAATYRLGADLQWQRDDVPDLVAWSGATPVASDSHRFAAVGTPDGRQVLASTSGTDWIYTSVDELLGEFPIAQPTSMTVTPDGLAQALMVRTDVAAEQGGISITSGAFTITHASNNGPLTITDTATGEVITGWTENWSAPVTAPQSVPMATYARDNQVVELAAADGTVLATLTNLEYQSLYAYDESPEWVIATTADGVNVALESPAELLGVDATDIVGVRVNSVGRQVIATVVLQNEVSPGVKEQRVLVGTPNV